MARPSIRRRLATQLPPPRARRHLWRSAAHSLELGDPQPKCPYFAAFCQGLPPRLRPQSARQAALARLSGGESSSSSAYWAALGVVGDEAMSHGPDHPGGQQAQHVGGYRARGLRVARMAGIRRRNAKEAAHAIVPSARRRYARLGLLRSFTADKPDNPHMGYKLPGTHLERSCRLSAKWRYLVRVVRISVPGSGKAGQPRPRLAGHSRRSDSRRERHR